MKILVDFSFDDQITFALDTQALINWPQPAIASLPISLSLSLLKLNGTVFVSPLCLLMTRNQIVIEFGIEGNNEPEKASLSFYILEDFLLEFGVGSLLGHRTKVKDLPKLTFLIVNALRQVFIKNLVYPAKKVVPLSKKLPVEP